MNISSKGHCAVLYRKEMVPDWLDATDPGVEKPQWVVAATIMFDDPGDTIYIGAKDENGKWKSFEGQSWYFETEIAKKGMRGEIVTFTASFEINPPKE